MPFELLAHTVSHLKALIRYNLEPRRQGHGSNFSICHALLKNAILLHVEATVRIFFGPSVFASSETSTGLPGNYIYSFCSPWYAPKKLYFYRYIILTIAFQKETIFQFL